MGGTVAPNGMIWSDYCMSSPVGIDTYGFPAGAWGECIAYAKIFELENPDWGSNPNYQDEGPCGQVIGAMMRAGGRGMEQGLEQAGNRLEEAVENNFRTGQPIPF